MTAGEVAHSLHIGLNRASRKLNQLAKYRFVTKSLKMTLMGTHQHHRIFRYALRGK